METYKFLLDLCLILLSTKVLGLLTRKFSMPQVVGALLFSELLHRLTLSAIQRKLA